MWCKNCEAHIDDTEHYCHVCLKHKIENVKGPIIEEGVVIAKGTSGGSIMENFLSVLLAVGSGGVGSAHEASEDEHYWAKIKVPSLQEPIKIKSKYNFSKGTKVRIKYYPNLKEGELVVDW